jgi:hypothetical protein
MAAFQGDVMGTSAKSLSISFLNILYKTEIVAPSHIIESIMKKNQTHSHGAYGFVILRPLPGRGKGWPCSRLITLGNISRLY